MFVFEARWVCLWIAVTIQFLRLPVVVLPISRHCPWLIFDGCGSTVHGTVRTLFSVFCTRRALSCGEQGASCLTIGFSSYSSFVLSASLRFLLALYKYASGIAWWPPRCGRQTADTDCLLSVRFSFASQGPGGVRGRKPVLEYGLRCAVHTYRRGLQPRHSAGGDRVLQPCSKPADDRCGWEFYRCLPFSLWVELARSTSASTLREQTHYKTEIHVF